MSYRKSLSRNPPGKRQKKQQIDIPRRRLPLHLEVLEPRLLLAANGADTRHLRLAVTATEEYTAFFGGRIEAQAAIEKTIDGVNKVFQRELNLQLDLIDNLDIIFGPGNSPDPFPSGGPGFVPNQTLVDNVIGPANYDIGILLGGIPVGLAFLGGGGIEGSKAKAFSGFTPAEGGPAGANAISNALHELGHLLSAEHPANGTLGTCATGRSAGSAYEPGSGSTIISYAGICMGDNLQVYNDDYYHSANLDQMIAHLEMLDGLGVGTKELATNTVPTVNAGTDFTVPARTPFEISVSGADADDPSGKSLRYTLEQRDLGPAQTLAPFPGDNGASPLFRSFPPSPAQSDTFTRIFPQLSDILTNTSTKGEALPTTSRALNFRATVRDGVGGTNGDDVRITVVDTGAPFQVTTLNTATVLTGGSTHDVTWDVAGTDGNGINAASVKIYLSTDGGLSFPHLLATTANDGSHTITVPNLETAQARIKIQGEGQIFFDVSDADVAITIVDSVPGVAITGELFVSERGAFGPESDTYTLALTSAPAASVQITVNANEQVLVSTDGATFASSVSFTRTDTTPQTITVRARNDGNSEGAHGSLLSHVITSSSDPDYSTSMIIDQLAVSIADDEQPPLIAVDLQSPGLPVPRNWTEINALSTTSAPSTFSNLRREDGLSTEIDLTLTPTPGTSVSASADEVGSLTVPIHTPGLQDSEGAVYFDQFFAPGLSSVGVTATWSGLTPGKRYNVYVLAVEHFGLSFTGAPWIVNQTVTIRGAGTDDPTPFVQNSTARQRQLLINDQEGDDTRTLESFAKAVTADESGEIEIEIRRDDGSDVNRVIISGLAVQEIPPPPPVTFDFGDAPDSVETPRYPTLLANNGAVHIVGPLFLGSTIDAEADGQPDETAGQDADGGDDDIGIGDDEDGVVTIATPVTNQNAATIASLVVKASQAGKLDAWIDFDQDDVFDDPSEHLGLGTSINLVAGDNVLTYTVPAGAIPGVTFARFRISTSGDLLPTGSAADGEVEDHLVTLLDGDNVAGAAARVGAPTTGSYELTADGDSVVVRRGAQNFFRAPANSLASIEVVGTDGDDIVSLSNLPDAFIGPVIADAKAGNDSLRLVGAGQLLDLTAIPESQLQGFEIIDIVGDGDNSLKLIVTDVLDLSSSTNTLLVRSNRGDTVDVGAGWTIADTVVESGVFLRVLTQGAATLRLAGPNDWTNPIRRLDVNANSTVEPQDVLVIINELNDPRFSDSVRALVSAATVEDFPNFYYDTNSDGFAAPQDALVVINFLNGGGGPEGEGSGSSGGLDTLAFDWIFAQLNDESTRENSLSNVVAHVRRPARSTVFWVQPTIRPTIAQARSNKESLDLDTLSALELQGESLFQEIQKLLHLVG